MSRVQGIFLAHTAVKTAWDGLVFSAAVCDADTLGPEVAVGPQSILVETVPPGRHQALHVTRSGARRT